MVRSLQYAFIAIIVTTVGFSLYQWNASRASTQKTAPNNGLVGYWSFNEGTGTQAGDASGNGNTGTLTNGPTWTTGKLGQALDFDGTDDYTTTSDADTLDVIDSTNFTLTGWFNRDTFTTDDTIIGKSNGQASSDTGYNIYIDDSTDKLTFVANDGTDQYKKESVSTFTATGWHHFVLSWDDSSSANTKLYIDGLSEATTDTGTFANVNSLDNALTFRLGAESDNGNPFDGKIDEVRMYNRALSGTEVTNLYNLGAEKLNVSPVSNLTSGLVGYWTFDGKDTPWSSSSAGTATDRSGNSNTGTLTNMSQSTSVLRGQLGQALNFDGVDDVVIASGNPASLQLVTAFTLSGWIKASTDKNEYRTIIDKSVSATDRNYWLALDTTTGYLGLRFSVGGVSKSFISTKNLADDTWHHVVATYDGSFVNLYSDGVSVMTPVAQSGSTDNPVSSVRIGGENVVGTRDFIGSIDEVRIYNRVVSAGEIQSLYDLGASDKVNSSVSQNQGTGRLDSGLVGYWPLDDASGTNANDASTNNNDGTLTNSPTWGTGQIGGDVVFDGTDDHITMGDATALKLTGAFTTSAWIYPQSFGGGSRGRIIDKLGGASSGYIFFIDNSNLTNGIEICVNNCNYPSTNARGVANAVTLNTWQHFVASFDGTNVTLYKNGASLGSQSLSAPNSGIANFAIGGKTSANDRNFNGNIDEVRVYKRALSADEVSQLYRLTAPTGIDTSLKGYWSFDGSATNWTSSSAGTVTDRSGSANTGTLTNMSQSTSVIRGKLGQALNFDGTDDYTTTPDSSTLDITDSTNFTLTGWFNRDTFTTDDTIIAKSNGQASSDTGYNIYIDDSTDKLTIVGNDGTDQYKMESVSTFTATDWHHFALVWDDSSSANTKLYIDGVSEAATTTGTFANVNSLANALTFRIGAESDNGNPFDGKIDEVRIYNRALSASEISALYNSSR